MLDTGRSPTLRYGVAAMSVAVITVIRLLLHSLLGAYARFLPFFLAVTFSSWYGGLGPGLLATALAAVIADTLILEPVGRPRFDFVQLTLFCMVGAVISYLNDSLQSELAERRRAERASQGQTRMLIRMIEQLARGHELAELPGIVLAAMVEQLHASGGVLYAYSEVDDTCSLVLDYEDGRLLTPEQIGQSPLLAIDHSHTPGWQQVKARYLRGESIVATDHFRDHPAFDPAVGAALEAMGVRTVLAVPLLRQGRMVGGLLYYAVRSTRPENYGPGDLELAQALAHQATLAMQLSRLAEQARQTAVLEERNRMAREIHDTLAQAFTGILAQLGAAALLASEPERGQTHLQKARDLAREGLADARRSVQALRPQALEQADLVGALARLTAQMSADRTTRIAFRLTGTPHPLPPTVADHLLRIGQEALTNALQHAQASEVWVALTFGAAELRLRVTDNGQGFAVDGPRRPEGFGLTGMQERAHLIDARFAVSSQPERGTQVEVTWPFPPGEG
jgi:signal transduction histidine kinase